MAEEVGPRAQARIHEYDLAFEAAGHLSLLRRFLGPEFVTQGHVRVLSGASGTGKTHLAVANATGPSRMASRPSPPRPRP